MKTFLTIILTLFSTIASAQSLKKIEQKLAPYLSRIGTAINHSYYDTLEQDNDHFGKLLKKYLSSMPSTMTYSFSTLAKKGLDIATSQDNNLRIYSWDTHTGGSMHFFANLYQYRIGKNIYAVSPKEYEGEGDDARGFYSEIFTVDSINRIYIGLYNGIYSTKDCGIRMQAFKIENNGLNDSLILFKVTHYHFSHDTDTMYTAMSNELGFGFNFFSVVDRPERPVKLVYYDEKTKTLKLPLLGDNDSVTNEFYYYRYNGKYFEGVE
jgi:hypothetical protein